ncbi:MAG: hypothetical protein CMD72_01005 [Gammaproteobacteria bacterium]|nr:hypothetical protein [Gammaproteobacteria bacterium]
MTLRKESKKQKKTLSENEVLEFLAENPKVINKNIDLFNQMFSFDKNKGNIISFEDIRIKSLIKENDSLKKKLKGIVDTAKSNKKIHEKLSKFSNEVIAFRGIEQLISYIEDFIDKEFSSLRIDFSLIKFNGFLGLDKKYFPENNNLINLINNTFLEKNPILITKEIIQKYSLERFIQDKESLVICPLGVEYPTGVILVRYKSEMMGVDLQFDLLRSLAETISYSLEQYIQK